MKRRTCFVVTPFGKRDCGRDKSGASVEIDFDSVFDTLIKPAIENELQYECMRAKDDFAPGAIQDQMYNMLIKADLVIADLSQVNANVYYELGIRHAIRPNTTVLLKHINTIDLPTPFDIVQLKYATYNHENEQGIKDGIDAIVRAVKAAKGGAEPDSDVHRIIKDEEKAKGPIKETHRVEHAIADRPDARIGYITGELLNVKDVDVWVNSENTQMEMARFCESAISASLRFHGATNFVHNDVVLASDDKISNVLRMEAGKVMRRQLQAVYASLDDGKQRAQLSRVRRKGVQVEPHTVILTTSGSLANPPNNVKLLAHVAAVQGKPTKGFSPVDNLGRCVTRVLEEVTAYNLKNRRRNPLRSVLFPLFGTGQARQDPALVTDQLISAAMDFLSHQTAAHAPRTVLFLAYTRAQRDLLERELGAFPQLVAPTAEPAPSGKRGRPL